MLASIRCRRIRYQEQLFPAVTVTVASSTGDPWSRPNIERFRGTWQFTYTKDRAAITDTFRLNFITERSDEPGEWAIGGLQDDGSIAALFYSRDVDSYVWAHGDKEDDRSRRTLFLQPDQPTIVSGCYHEILSSTSLSSCYPMTGVKTSSSTLSSLQRAQPNTTAAQPELDSKIIRVLEELAGGLTGGLASIVLALPRHFQPRLPECRHHGVPVAHGPPASVVGCGGGFLRRFRCNLASIINFI